MHVYVRDVHLYPARSACYLSCTCGSCGMGGLVSALRLSKCVSLRLSKCVSTCRMPGFKVRL
jgi:hypothetical protein